MVKARRVPDYVLAASVAVLNDFIPLVIKGPGAIEDHELQADWRARLDIMRGDLRAAARSVSLGDDLAFIIEGYGLSATDPRAVITGMTRVLSAMRARVPVSGLSVAAQQQRLNEQALTGLIEWLALASQANALLRMDFKSHGEANKYRVAFAQSFDTAIERASVAGMIEVVRTLRGLMAIVIRDLIERGRPLARVASYQTAVALPATVLAHQLYYDAGRAGEIIAENAAENPAFMPLSGVAMSR